MNSDTANYPPWKGRVLYTRPFHQFNEKHKPDKTMSENLHQLSEEELAKLIGSAQKTLRHRQLGKRKEVAAQIKELAASVGCTVELTEISTGNPGGSPRKGAKVAVKYRDPENPKHQWSGRGMQPKWLRGLIEQGRSLDEFGVA
jgi:DNA-binding protein H-NS